MSNSVNKNLNILYLGRRKEISSALEAALTQYKNGASDSDTPIQFVVVKNQKAALATTRTAPPNVVLIEMDSKPDHRLRFCEMLRYRLPMAALFAVCSGALNTSFEFDWELQTPINYEEAIERLTASCKEYNGNQLAQGHIHLDIAKRIVTTGDKQYPMTPKQCALLNLLMQNHDEVVTRAEIMEQIWETSFLDDTRTLDVHVRWLRECIEPDPSKPQYLQTVRGVGYRLILE
ncbi:MAG: winged helix-turn-helix domain-containing protein [Chloroflexota bacterium]